MRTLIAARHVSKRFFLHHLRPTNIKDRALELVGARPRVPDEEFWALRDISIDIIEGEAVGLIGRNGSGKSTLLRIMAGILTPTSGEVWVPRGTRIGTMIELGVGFHPELTGRENVFMTAAIHGLTRAETDAIYDRIVEYAEIGPFMDVPLMNYSSGMQVRLGFAASIHLDPDVLLIDEIFAVGDEDFQQRCRETMLQFRARGKTIIFVSHSSESIRQICDRVCVLDASRLCFDGGAETGLDRYHAVLAESAHRTVERR